MKLTNLIQVKGYEAGRNGNMLVALDEKLIQDMSYKTEKKVYDIKMLVTTANVKNLEDQEYLRRFTDGTVDVSRVIVVGKKFLHLFNKTQLILLAERNHREDVIETAACDEEVISYGHVQTISQYGSFRSQMAFNKERKIMEFDERKAGNGLKKQNRKELRKAKKAAKKGEPLTPEMDKEKAQEYMSSVKDVAKDFIDADTSMTDEEKAEVKEVINNIQGGVPVTESAVEAAEEAPKKGGIFQAGGKQSKKATGNKKDPVAEAQAVADAAAALNPATT